MKSEFYIPVGKIEETGVAAAFYTTKEEKEWNDEEKYRHLTPFLNITPERMVRASQTHTAVVRVITSENCGEGVVRPFGMTDYDGMITNEKGVCLLTVEADCTPVWLLDINKKAVGIVHSGWRGTAGKITAVAIRKMTEKYGTSPSDVIAVIGPHNCRKCYEVDRDIIAEFAEHFTESEIKTFFVPKVGGKYLLDMAGAITLSLIGAGVLAENISDEKRCTFHEDVFCSYRRYKSKTERMLTGIMLK